MIGLDANAQERFESVEADIARQLALISSYSERHVLAVQRLEEEAPEVPEDSSSEAWIGIYKRLFYRSMPF